MEHLEKDDCGSHFEARSLKKLTGNQRVEVGTTSHFREHLTKTGYTKDDEIRKEPRRPEMAHV